MKLFGKRNGGEQQRVVRSTQSQLPMLGLADSARNNVIAVVGEFVGTFLFLFFSFAGTQVSNTPKPVAGAPPNTSNLLYSALSFGFSLTVNIWAFYRVTGGLFNPVVSPINNQHCSSATDGVGLLGTMLGRRHATHSRRLRLRRTACRWHCSCRRCQRSVSG
jgi:hypothetical protein